jgi:hypothetical protein
MRQIIKQGQQNFRVFFKDFGDSQRVTFYARCLVLKKFTKKGKLLWMLNVIEHCNALKGKCCESTLSTTTRLFGLGTLKRSPSLH